MALDTYAGLKAAIASWSHRSDQTDNMDDFVFWAHQEICRRLRANVLLASADVTLSAETVAQPTGFLAMRRFYLDVTPRRRLQTTSSEGAMDMSSQLASATYPTHVAVEGASLRFAPLFTGTTTIGKALYYKAPVLMVADADTNTVLAKYPYLYLHGALEALFTYVEDDNLAQRHGSKFGALVEDINAKDSADTMSGELQTASFAGGIV